ncbi:MAG: Ribosomal large subunit pseudouridine synthase C [Candidatus Anoxychlamydiales bacterium]|nr:Ribosomal large subunit pseudouridine synthase C [Candidatus Anoxychlamydiales bacterium]NGX36197.1 Ribosomal large subunit pseudouridine synthase C [Candidatus Anoxychlamydiales bacterium]
MQKKYYLWKITKKDVDKKLLTFLKDELGVSNKQIKKALDKGKCSINGKIERFGSTKLKKGDEIKLSALWQESSEKKNLSLKILYEDDFFIAIDKPINFESSDKNLHLFFPRKYTLIHRLDKDVSGVLLIAKTHQFKEQMIKDVFKNEKILKTYLAILDGTINEKTKKIESNLGKIKSFQGQTIYGSTRHGKYALSYLKVLKKYKDKTLVELIPITGRTHQLRVHMKQISHPILGDFLYAKKFSCADDISRLMLHAEKIEFDHPITFENIEIASDIPEEFN